jgi:D-alanyl-lipoteichoic acid acyltransferase DltB (MBOAT superfamily)
VIDIYKDRIKVEKNFADYGYFVSFPPLLLVEPSERAIHFSIQIKKLRTLGILD